MGIICALFGFIVSWATDMDLRAVGWFILTVPIIVILVVVFYHLIAGAPTTFERVASKTTESITSHYVKHLLLSIGGYVMGAFISPFLKRFGE